MGKTNSLLHECLKLEMDPEEKIEGTWEGLQDGWSPYLRNNVLTLSFFMLEAQGIWQK